MQDNKDKTTMATKKDWGYHKIIEFCAYIGTACIAIALVLSAIFKGQGDLFRAFNIVGQAIAYILAMVLAAGWVKRKKHVAWLVCYLVFVVVIIVMYVVTLV